MHCSQALSVATSILLLHLWELYMLTCNASFPISFYPQSYCTLELFLNGYRRTGVDGIEGAEYVSVDRFHARGTGCPVFQSAQILGHSYLQATGMGQLFPALFPGDCAILSPKSKHKLSLLTSLNPASSLLYFLEAFLGIWGKGQILLIIFKVFYPVVLLSRNIFSKSNVLIRI